VATCFPGEPLGEMSLFTDAPRSATVRADGEAEVLRLDRGRFLELVRRDPSVALAVATTLSRRLQTADTRRAAGGAPDSEGEDPHLRIDRTPDLGPARARGIDPSSDAVRRPRWRPDRAVAGLVLAGLALLVGWAAPPPEGLSLSGWHALATLGAFVALLALEALPDGALSLALVAVWVAAGVVPVTVALSGFTTPAWVLIVTIFGVGAAVASCGLLFRLALWAVTRRHGGFPGQIVLLGVTGLVVGATVPSATGRVTFIAPAITEVAEALGHAPGSRAAAGLAMAVLVGFGLMAAPFLTSSSPTLLAYAVLPPEARIGLDWGEWAVRAAPTHLILLPGLLAVVIWLYRPGRAGPASFESRLDRDYVLALQHALLGPLSRPERIAASVLVLQLVAFATQSLHQVDPTWITVAGFAVLAATRVLTSQELRAVNWDFVLLFGVLASMPAVFAQTGLDRWLAGLVAGAVGGFAGTPLLFVAALTLLSFGVSLVVRWQAAAPLLTLALRPVATAAGVDPWVVAIVALVACNCFFFPYQSTIYLALFHGTGGQLFSHAQARPLALWYAALALLALCASVPAWHAMGLL
jgi:DASS family divalent anion:Na+ symporter